MARMMLALAASVLAFALCARAGPYTPDMNWPTSIPANASSFSAIALDTIHREVYVTQRSAAYPQPILVFDLEGNLLRTWGNTTISHDAGGWGLHGLNFEAVSGVGYIWVTDTGDHTVKKFSTPDNKLIQTLGTPGTAGSGLIPLQFGNPADVDFSADLVFIADGDGGVNNRVDAVAFSGAEEWVAGSNRPGTQAGQFNVPHSVAYYATKDLVFVADRGNNRTQAFAAKTGKYIGEWTCMRPGSPWGIRTWTAQDLLFQADGHGQSISILDLSGTTSTSLGVCSILATVDIDPALCTSPHEIAVDQVYGEIYVACMGEHARVVRYKQECAEKPCNFRA